MKGLPLTPTPMPPAGQWLLAIMVAALALPSPAPAAKDELTVWFREPDERSYIYGDVELWADTWAPEGEEVVAVEFFVNGRSAGTLTRPPYKLTTDVGYENVRHTLKVVARGRSGKRAEYEITTDIVVVDDKIKVNLQQLYATVSRGGRRVPGLRKEDFRVSDEGARQEIVTFEGGDVPLTAVLLLDCSDSMTGARMEAALDGAAVFVDGMAELDEASVMLFSDRLLRASPFTSDAAALRVALSDVRPSGGTSLNDHLYLAVQRLEERQGRRVLVLFSDGADHLSVLPMKEVLGTARESPALIYWIYLKGKDESVIPSSSSSWRDSEANEAEFLALRRAVEGSGGKVQILDHFDQVSAAFGAIIEELRAQYVLGYYPTNRRGKGDWHKVKVRVHGENLEVRTRGGYFDW